MHNLQEANLKGANLYRANIEGTNFKDADLDVADFSQIKNFTEEQIQEAKNWQRVRRDIK